MDAGHDPVPGPTVSVRRVGGRGAFSIGVAEQLPMCRQQRHLRPLGQQPLAGVEDVGHLTGIPGDGGDTDLRSAVQVLATDLGSGNREAAPQLGHDRPNHGALALERVDVAQ
jgi:hypothetical protein